MWCTKLVTLFALVASVSSCSIYTDCPSCTLHQNNCLFIGLDDEFICIDKVQAYMYDFDYVAEVEEDCDVIVDCKFIPEHTHIKRNHITFQRSGLFKK